jgi:hypothetical protein
METLFSDGIAYYYLDSGLVSGHSEKPNMNLIIPILFLFLTYFCPCIAHTGPLLENLYVAELVKKFYAVQNSEVLPATESCSQ